MLRLSTAIGALFLIATPAAAQTAFDTRTAQVRDMTRDMNRETMDHFVDSSSKLNDDALKAAETSKTTSVENALPAED